MTSGMLEKSSSPGERMRFVPVFFKTILLGGAVGGAYGGLVGVLFGLGTLIVGLILWPDAPEAGNPAIVVVEGLVGLIIGLVGGLAVALPAGFVIGLEAAFVRSPHSATFRLLAALQVGTGCLLFLPSQLFPHDSLNGGGGLIGDGLLDTVLQLALFKVIPAVLAGGFIYLRLPRMLGASGNRVARVKSVGSTHNSELAGGQL